MRRGKILSELRGNGYKYSEEEKYKILLKSNFIGAGRYFLHRYYYLSWEAMVIISILKKKGISFLKSTYLRNIEILLKRKIIWEAIVINVLQKNKC